MVRCLLGLGANLGDAMSTLHQALQELRRLSVREEIHISSIFCSTAIGGPKDQPEYFNAAARLFADRSPLQLLEYLQNLESKFGRKREAKWGPRTLDVDLLLYGEAIIDDPQLTVPHPRMAFRRFVLAPAAEVAGEMIHPQTGLSVQQLLDRLDMLPDVIAISGGSREWREQVQREVAEVVATLDSTSSDGSQLRIVSELTKLLESQPPPKLIVVAGTDCDIPKWLKQVPRLNVSDREVTDAVREITAAFAAMSSVSVVRKIPS